VIAAGFWRAPENFRTAHHVSPRAEQIVNLALSRCQRHSQGVEQIVNLAPEKSRKLGVAAAYVTLARQSTRITLARPSLSAEPEAPREPEAEQIVYLTLSQRPEHCATHNERRRGQPTGHLDQVSVTHNERRRRQRPKPITGIAHVPLHHKRPAFA
jgi:hypothetical protein